MAEQYPVCWQDQRLIFGSLNNVYQELARYESIVDLWNEIPPEANAIWIGQPNASALILQADTTRPYGADCYTVEIKRDIMSYPQIIALLNE